MKRMFALLLAALCLSFAACAAKDAPDGAKEPDPAPDPPAGPAPVSQPEPVEGPEPETVWKGVDGVTLSLLQESYPVGVQEITLVIDNRSDQEICYGEDLSCQRFVDGAWQDVPFKDRVYCIEVAYCLPADSVGTLGLDMGFFDHAMEEGLYRLTGSEIYFSDPREVSEPWRLDLRVTAEAQPEPDYALYISEEPIPTVDGCLVTDRLPVYFINNTGKEGYALSIPHLERKNESGEWEPVPWKDGVGFCGTPDPLPMGGRAWSEDIPMLWGALEDGAYRLSYEVGPTFETEEWARGEFTLYTPEGDQGLPLFSAEVFPNGEDGPGWTLPQEDAARLLGIFQAGEWTEGTADCLSDYRLVLAGQTVYFHSDCGTFNDTENERSFSVSEEDRTAILAMLQK